MANLILASSSPRRQGLIQTLGIPYEIMASQVDESTSPDMTADEIVEELALRKATAIYETLKKHRNEGIIIGADTIVAYQGEVLGKPADFNDALHTLKKLQGKTHQVYSSISIVELGTGDHKVAHRVTDVTMKPLSDEEIKAYIKTGEPMDKAGSYGIQGIGALLVDNIQGDYYNVVGMSLALLSHMLKGLIDLPVFKKSK